MHSAQENIIFQHYYKSYCDYLSKMNRMEEQQAVFEQLTLSDFKNRSSITLRTFNNSAIIMINNSGKKRISWVWCFCLCCFFWVAFFELFLTGFSGEFQFVFENDIPKSSKSPFEHFEGKNCISLACLPCGLIFP